MATDLKPIYDVARTISEQHDHDEPAVISELATTLRNTPALLDLAITYAAEELAQRVVRNVRANIATATPNPDRGLAAEVAEMERLYDMYLNWPLSNGVPLHKATKAQVSENAARYQMQGRTMMVRADWLARIANKMGRAETVGEALDGQALQKLYREADKKWSA